MKSDVSKDLEDWVRRINEEEFPLFAHTARSIASLSSDYDTSIHELAQVILGDNAMTARVLRMANSVYYNPQRRRINTVSRAVVVLGFEVVRSIALSISLIDTILTGGRHDAAIGELVKSFHAAVQAKELARERHVVNTEEIFIAALLNRLGSVAFWCFPYDKDVALVKAYQVLDSPAKAEQQTLGFTLEQLTSALAKEWNLSTLLMGALRHSSTQDRSVKDIEHSFRLANAVVAGWETEEVNKVIGEMSSDMNSSEDAVRSLVYDSAKKAVRMIEKFGIKIASQYIPAIPDQVGRDHTENEGVGESKVSFQLDVLRELSTMLSEKVDINMVLGAVLEGIHRALDMDHVVLSFVRKDKKNIIAKSVLGENRVEFGKMFNFPLTKRENIFMHILEVNEPLWMDRKKRVDLGVLMPPEISNVLGQVEFFVAPLRIGGKPMGVIYADRFLKRESLDKHAYLTFKHFCEQANIAFSILGR